MLDSVPSIRLDFTCCAGSMVIRSVRSSSLSAFGSVLSNSVIRRKRSMVIEAAELYSRSSPAKIRYI